MCYSLSFCQFLYSVPFSSRLQQKDRGLVCGVGFMGAPAILIEKPPNGRETCLALDTLRRVLASGVCEGVEDGKVSREGVEVVEKTYSWIDGTKFTGSFATRESLANVNMAKVSKVFSFLLVHTV